MPPYQKLYYVLGVGVGVSAVVTALPFHFVCAALFLFVCGYGVLCMVDSNKKRIPIIGMGVMLIVVRLGVLRYTEVQAQTNIGSVIQGIAQIEEVHTKEKSADVIVQFDSIKVTAAIFGGQIPVVGSRVSAYCIAEKIADIKEIPLEKMKAIHGVYVGCKKFAWSLHATDSWRYTFATWRAILQEKLSNHVKQKNAFLLDGMVFGDDSHIPREAKEDFKKSGISHILAVSGFNIALFGVWGLSMLMWFGIPRKIASIFMIVLIVIFVEMVGGGASVVRAAIMGCVQLCGALLNRVTVTKHIFWVTILIMIVWQPYSLWYDIGFQLSAIATAGLLYTTPQLTKKFPRWLSLDSVITQTIAVTIVTAPVLLWHFGTVSLLGLLTNVLIAIPVTQIMGLVVVRLLMGVLGMGDWYLALIQDWLLKFLYEIAQVIARYDYINIHVTSAMMLLMGSLLLFAIQYRIKMKNNGILINNELWRIISL